MTGCARTIAVLSLLLPAAGCATAHKVAVDETGAPQYRHIDISYCIPASHRAIVRSKVNFIRVAGEDDQATVANQSTATLRIQYPHPHNKPGMARATLRIGDKQQRSEPQSLIRRVRSSISWLPGSEPPTAALHSVDDDVWTLDLPRQQLDLMLADLAHSGFFEDQERHEGTAHLSIAIDRGSVSKTWSPEARLDDIALRVQQQGWQADDRVK